MFARERGVDQPLLAYEGPKVLMLVTRAVRCGIEPALSRDSSVDVSAEDSCGPSSDGSEVEGMSRGVVAGDG